MSIFTEAKIDCHCHLLDPAGFPYTAATPYQPAGQEITTAKQLHHVMQAHGVERALLVQPNSGYGEDNRCMLAAIAAARDRLKGVAVVPHDVSRAELQRLKDAGVVGVAFNVPFHGLDHYLDTGSLLAKLEALDMFLQIQVQDDQLLGLLPLLQGSRTRLLVDHCGRPDVAQGLQQPAFQALLALGRSGRASVKLSGYIKYAKRSHPYEDAWPFVRALVEAFGADASMWGSDWPFLRAPERVDYAPLLTLFATLFPNAAERRKILWETPARLFGFTQV
ncbi:MAG: amidohydrolase family protein [Hyphomicrobiales bacterium]|nr:amidohydrolase family protein [Hyphomicrobiales bacterium]